MLLASAVKVKSNLCSAGLPSSGGESPPLLLVRGEERGAATLGMMLVDSQLSLLLLSAALPLNHPLNQPPPPAAVGEGELAACSVLAGTWLACETRGDASQLCSACCRITALTW